MNASGEVTIRPAVTEDAEALAHLHVDVWEEAYSDLMPATVFEERRATISERIERWRTILTQSPAPTTVAESDIRPIGFISVGPPRDDDVEVDHEVWAIYVRAAWWGKGVGHSLLTTALEDRPAYLWVLLGNDRAARFYRAHGFQEDGATRYDEFGTEVRLVRRA